MSEILARSVTRLLNQRLADYTAPAGAPTFAALDRRRRALGIAAETLVRAAGVDRMTWYAGRAGKAATRQATLRQIAAALDRLAEGGAATRPPALIAAALRAIEEIIRQKIRGGQALIVACDPKRWRKRASVPRALSAQRVRRLALYIMAVEIEVDNADLARALGCSRQNIKQLRTEIEDLRDDPRVDALLDRVAALVKGTKAT